MENDEKKYADIIKALKSLKEVKAPANFEADLQRRINREKISKEEKKSFWQNIFVPARLIPSLGLVAAAVVIFFVVETSSEEMDNPFLIEPRVREDVFAVTDFDEVEKKQDELSKQKSQKKEEPTEERRKTETRSKSSDDKMTLSENETEPGRMLTDEKDLARDQYILKDDLAAAESTETTVTESPQPTVLTETGTDMVTGQTITKDELNFRQIQLTEEQRRAVNELRNQVQSPEKVNKTQK
jgi:hypothetical protein